MVDIQWVYPKDLKHDLGKQEPITLAFKDYNCIAINEYFDIPGNAWSHNNLSAALDEAQNMCLSYKGYMIYDYAKYKEIAVNKLDPVVRSLLVKVIGNNDN